MNSERPHPNGDDLYTPVTDPLLDLFERMRYEHGTWRKVAAITGTKLRVLRNVRNGNRKAISQTLLDRLCSGTNVGSVHEFPWYEANELVAMGLWDPIQYVEGSKRIQGGVVRDAIPKGDAKIKNGKPEREQGKKPNGK